MSKNHLKKEDIRQSQQGSGSAENRGSSREEQKNRSAKLNKPEKRKIAAKMGEGPNPLTDLRNTGAMSGRDDYAGGDSEGMSDQSTGQPTER